MIGILQMKKAQITMMMNDAELSVKWMIWTQ